MGAMNIQAERVRCRVRREAFLGNAPATLSVAMTLVVLTSACPRPQRPT